MSTERSHCGVALAGVWLCLEGRSDEREDESGSSELGELEFAEQSRVGAGAIQNRKGDGKRRRRTRTKGREGGNRTASAWRFPLELVRLLEKIG
jgi:hypothetical protein